MSICEDTVIEFLTRNPAFLLRNPDLVRHIEVPHGFNGKTVSLIEHQAQLLRDRLRGIEQQYESETLRSQAHRSLGRAMYTAVRLMYQTDESDEPLRLLKHFLTGHYAANNIRIFAAGDIASVSSKEQRHLLRALDPWRRSLFTELLNHPKPLCDSLQYEHRVALFAKAAEQIHSSLLLPFRLYGDEALLAVGSDSWHQYQQGIELDMLRTVLEVVSSVTEPSATEMGKNPVSSAIRG
jgi:uncharacterized protein YigA (DUF484 family)